MERGTVKALSQRISKPTLTACKGKITILNPVVTSKGKFPKSEDNKFVQGTVKETLAFKGTNQRTKKAIPEPEGLEDNTLDTVVDGQTLREIIPTLPFTFQFNRNLKPEDMKDMDQSLQLHQLLKDLFQWSMDNTRLQRTYENHQRLESHQAVQTSGGEGKQDKGESIHYPSYRRTTDPDRENSDSFRLTRSRRNQLSSGFTPFRNQQVSAQESPFFTLPGGFQEKRRTQGQEQDLFSPKAERVRPNDPETVGLGERSTQEPEVVVNDSRINSPLNRNITPTQIEHNAVSPESNLNSDVLWLKISQYSEKTQNQFAELEESHERIKKLTSSIDKIVETLQEGHAQLRNVSEEINRILDIVFKENTIAEEAAKKKNSCHNFGSTDHYANNRPKEKKKVYAIEKVPEEQYPIEDSDSDSMGDAIRAQSDEEKDPREEFLVEYQEENPLEIQDIQLEAGISQDTANKNLCKHTQDAQKFLVTPTKGMAYIHGTATKMTVFIDNAQHLLIIYSGEHFSIVARNYPENHFSNRENQLLPTKAKNFNSSSGKMTSIGTIIKEIIVPHRKGNIRLKPEFFVVDDSHIQGFLLGTDY
ncbi:hypothetical protein O181_031279 [Austropuccinia psidii MF-1]|uniref:Uncharacterized protein n=1 Tax=Austropuccinia psidii MF-1 TaxID=1389203 RepID=A0A9Q3CUJ3_9BASI|nr:hypothetical protein [Austropuccinia psidii MF-1]